MDFFNTANSIAAHGEDYLQIFPILNGGTALRLNLPERDDVEIGITNGTGKHLFSFAYSNALNQTIELPLGDAGSGLYIVKVVTSKKSFTEKFILVR